MRTLRVLIAAVALAGAAIAASACGGDESEANQGTTQPSAQGGSNEQLCSAVSDLESSVDTVQGLDRNSSAADVKRALTGVVDAGKEVTSAVEAGPQADLSGLQSSVQDLEDALKAVPSSETLEAGIQQVQTAASSVAQEATSVSDSVGCDST